MEQVVDLTDSGPRDVPRAVQKKVGKWIERDRRGKLAGMVEAGQVDLDSIVGKKGEKMLHLAAREEAGECLDWLLGQGANPRLVDRRGNLPLHLALQAVIKDYSRARERELVQGLLGRAGGCLGVRNRRGFTPRELLVSLERARERREGRARPGPVDRPREKEPSEEEAWRSRMEEEAAEEYGDLQGRWEESREEGWQGEAGESYNAWADRIYEAFTARRRPPPPPTAPAAPRKPLAPEADPADLARAEENLRMLRLARLRERQRKMIERLFGSEDEVVAGSLPFRGAEDGEVLETLLEEVAGAGPEVLKRRIREEIRRWHPDKFWQKVGHRVAADHKEEVMEGVKRISQALTNYGK